MRYRYATALTAVLAGLLLLPEAFAAEISTLLQPIADVLGPQGWGGLYQGVYASLIDSIIFTLLFGGITTKFLGERFGKMASWALGIALAIALSVYMYNNNQTLASFGSYAALILALVITWLLYSIIEPIIDNRVLSFALAFVIGYSILKTIIGDDLLTSLGAVFSWLGLVYAICLFLTVFLLVRLLTGGLSFGGGGGGSWGSGASSFQSGSGFLDSVDKKWGEYRAERQEQRQKNAEQLATTVKNQLLENEQALAKNLDMEKATVSSVRQGLEELQQYVTNVERSVEPLRGTVRGASASADMAAYRQSIAQQRGSLDNYFTQIQNYARPLFEKEELLKKAKERSGAAQASIKTYIDGVQNEIGKTDGTVRLRKQSFELVKAYIADAKKHYDAVASEANTITNAKGNRVDFGLERVGKLAQKLAESEQAIQQYEQAFEPIAKSRQELARMLVELRTINQTYKDEAKVEEQYAELLRRFKASILKSQDLLNKYVNSLSVSDYNNANQAFVEAVAACTTIEQNQAAVQKAAQQTAEISQRLDAIKTELKQILSAESSDNLIKTANALRDAFTNAAAVSYMSQTLQGVVANYKEVMSSSDPAKRNKALANFRGRMTRSRAELVKDFKKILKGDDKHVKAAASVGVPDNYLATLIRGIKEDQEAIDQQLTRVETELAAQNVPQVPPKP